MKNTIQAFRKHIAFPLFLFIFVFIFVYSLSADSSKTLLGHGFPSTSDAFRNISQVLGSLFGGGAEKSSLLLEFANLPFLILAGILNLVLPANHVGFVIFSILVALGVTGFVRIAGMWLRLVFAHNVNIYSVYFVAFLGGIFYLLSAGSIQWLFTANLVYLYIFAFLPWLLMAFQKLLEEKDRKSLFWFVLTVVMAYPAFYGFSGIFPVLALFLLVGFAYVRGGKISFGALLKVVMIFFLANLLWLLPYLISTLNSPRGTMLWENEARITNFAENFELKYDMLYARDFSLKLQENDFIFTDFIKNWNTTLANGALAIVMIVAVVGLIYSILKHERNLIGRCVNFISIFTIIALLVYSNKSLWNFLSRVFTPYYYESSLPALPPFVIIQIFIYSLLFGIGTIYVVKFLERLFGISLVFLTGIFFVVLLFMVSFPVLQHGFLYEGLKVSIPKDYAELSKLIDSNPKLNSLIVLPLTFSDGWQQYQWGYRGYGFYDALTNAAVLDRSSFVYKGGYITFYEKVNRALRGSSIFDLKELLGQYNVKFFAIDNNIQMPSELRSYIQQTLIPTLDRSKDLIFIAEYGKIRLYGVR